MLFGQYLKNYNINLKIIKYCDVIKNVSFTKKSTTDRIEKLTNQTPSFLTNQIIECTFSLTNQN